MVEVVCVQAFSLTGPTNRAMGIASRKRECKTCNIYRALQRNKNGFKISKLASHEQLKTLFVVVGRNEGGTVYTTSHRTTSVVR